MFMEILKSILYGIVQGITEWLPISSTGHLDLLNAVLPFNVYSTAAENVQFWNMYKVVIQFGSIIAVILLYFTKLNPWASTKSAEEKKGTWNLWIKILIASIPAAIVGLLLDDIVDQYLSTPYVIAIALIVYGVLFIWIENRHKKAVIKSVEGISNKKAAEVGVFQMLALIPGTSRSGSTILGATLLGFSRGTATEFSFFMAIPVMFGASLLKIVKMKMSIGFSGLIVLLVGMLVAFVVSVVVIRSFMKYIRKHDFKIFGLYRIVFGILILVLAAAGILGTGFGA
ncbi:MAG: undecaprenyl-diphosphate phosphatase [Solobacterium sp.]|jgi:undecaprenyl-diphosphatase|nr:undecaprenyl-diphosphate phosphatase [Solobacterium sp.]MCH4222398.1 undecaprenyl-diphosphate phosphatase [Solobacterium sp.]MCH4265935.1 undecaprenyl-diphosphate phosphatase [Solobacterium sp.]